MTAVAEASATHEFRAGVVARDFDRVMAAMSERIRFKAPITDAARFEGKTEVGRVVRAVMDGLTEITYDEEIAGGSERAFRARGTVRGQAFEEAIWVHLDRDGLIEELTLYVRPLPGLTALTAELAPRLAVERGRGHAFVARALTAVLAAASRVGDPVALWLAGLRRR